MHNRYTKSGHNYQNTMILIENPTRMATVAEICNLSLNSGRIIQNSGSEDAYLNQQSEQLTKLGEQMKVSLATDRSQEKTEELAELDSRRDACLSALKLFTRGYMHWDRDNQPELSGRIYNIIKKHGLRMPYENYEEESALVESLLEELDEPANREAITSLNLGGLTGDLRDAQNAFSSVYRESIETEAAKEPVTAATKIKWEVLQIMSDTFDYLNAVNRAQPEVYGSLSANLAELVNPLNQRIRNRRNLN